MLAPSSCSQGASLRTLLGAGVEENAVALKRFFG